MFLGPLVFGFETMVPKCVRDHGTYNSLETMVPKYVRDHGT